MHTDTHTNAQMACSPWCLWSSLPSHLSSTAVLQPAQRWRRGNRQTQQQQKRNKKKKKGDKKKKSMTEIMKQDRMI